MHRSVGNVPAEEEGSGARTVRPILSPTALKLAAVLLLTFAAYVTTLAFQFVYDDQSQIVQNPNIQSWHFAPQLFVQQVWAQTGTTPLANYYRPLFMLWLLINYSLFGLHPAGWHLTTVAIHLLATFLVFQAAERVTDQKTALLCSLLFGIHPVHIESVAWISGVTDPLLTVFILAAFVFYVDAARGRRILRLTLSLVCYSCALLTKEPAVIFPAMVVGYEFLMSGKRPAGSPKALAIFLCLCLAVTGLYLLVRARVLGGVGHNLAPLPVPYVLLSAPSLLLFYGKHLIFPFGLSGFYGSHFVIAANVRDFWIPLICDLGAIYAIYRLWRGTGRAIVPFAFLLLCLPLLPLLNIRLVPAGQANHDRYLYLPSFGFCLLTAVALREGLRALERRLPNYRLQIVRSGRAVVAVIGVVWFAALTAQSQQWETSLILYSHDMRFAPRDGQLRCDLGNELFKMGLVEQAVAQYKIAQAYEPLLASYHLGLAYYQLQKYDYSAQQFERVLRLSPNDTDSLFFLGLSELKLHDLSAAEAALRQAISSSPDHLYYHYWLGMALKEDGALLPAEAEFWKELSLHPADETAKEQIAELQGALRSASN